jgi:hypothetical protein
MVITAARRTCLWLALALGMAMPASATAAGRVAVLLSDPAAAGMPSRRDTLSAFTWAESVQVLGPAEIAALLPPSPEALAEARTLGQVAALLATAEQAFAELDRPRLHAALFEVDRLLEVLPASPPAHAALIRARLAQARAALADGNQPARNQALAEAAAADPALRLDEVEYPPPLVQAFEQARAELASRPPRRMRIATEPGSAEVSVGGQLLGRAPLWVNLPPGRCRLVVELLGYRRETVACPAGTNDAEASLHLQPASREVIRDQLRDGLARDIRRLGDPRWLRLLAAELQVDWLLVLRAEPGTAPRTSLLWARSGGFVRLPAAATAATVRIAELGEAVGIAVSQAEGLTVRVVESAAGTPVVEARIGDPEALARLLVRVRPSGAGAYRQLELRRDPDGVLRAPLSPSASGPQPPSGRIDLEYLVEGFDASGRLRWHKGDPLRPLRFQADVSAPRSPPATPATSTAWYRRWWLWVAVSAVVATGVGVGIYYGTSPREVTIRWQ